MAKALEYSPLYGKSGCWGPFILRQLNGETIVQAAPTGRRKPWSRAQQAQRGRWAAAKQYAKAQSDDPTSKALYRTGIDGKCRSAYAVAVRDYLNAPEVTEVVVGGYRGRAGDVLRVQAVDDFAVVAVWVRLLHSDGSEREAGPAMQQADGTWHYTAKIAGPVVVGSYIEVEAYDRPGNVGRAQQALPTYTATAEPRGAVEKPRHKGLRTMMRTRRSLEAPAFWYASRCLQGGVMAGRGRWHWPRIDRLKGSLAGASGVHVPEEPVAAAGPRPHHRDLYLTMQLGIRNEAIFFAWLVLG